jgi:putative tryptophan/tyrosine transport system substrate-binding protein
MTLNILRLVVAFALGLSFGPVSAAAQPSPGHPARIGWITLWGPAATDSYLQAFRAGLAAHGYVEGRNVEIVQRSADGLRERLPAIAEEIAGLNLNVVVSVGPAIFALQPQVTMTPIIYGFSGDPMAAGFADSLARPRGNLTGVTYMSTELNEKRLELLHQAAPNAKRVVLLGSPIHPGVDLEVAASERMARDLQLEIRWEPVHNKEEVENLLTALETDLPDALVVLPDAVMLETRDRIAAFAARRHIPAISGWSDFARSGGLFTYGPRLPESYRRLADYVDKILKGARPAELPIERPTVFELVVNLTTAREIGLEMPQALLARADEVIE